MTTNTELTTDLETSIASYQTQYPEAPMVRIDQIQIIPLKESLNAMVKPTPNTTIVQYELPSAPLATSKEKIYDLLITIKIYTLSTFNLTKRARETAQLQRTLRTINKAKREYEHLITSQKVIEGAAITLQKSYTEISDFINLTEQRIHTAENLVSNNAPIQKNLEEITAIEKDLTETNLASEIAGLLGSEVKNQVQQTLSAKKTSLGREIAHYTRAQEYAKTIIEAYRQTITSAKETLRTLEESITTAGKQILDLNITITTYQGLTAPEANATLASAFLIQTARITEQLKTNIQRIHVQTIEQSEQYQLLPAPTIAPDPALDAARKVVEQELQKK